MEDVARLAGVSPQTVSRTLRGYQHVSEAAREKVLAAVKELGYRRNAAAAALASGRSRAIGVVALGEGSFRFGVMAGISAVAAASGYTVNMVTTPTQQPRDVARAVTMLLDQSVAGIVLALSLTGSDEELDRLLDEVPTIAIGGGRPEWDDAIAVDTVTATGNAVRYLLGLGHKTVHYVSGVGGAAFAQAWSDELTAHGRSVPPVFEGDWTPRAGYVIGAQIAHERGVTAVLVAGDEMAFGVMRALDDAGVRIPDDISVMGASSNQFSEWMNPPLSSVDDALDTQDERAVGYLLHRFGGASEPYISELVVPELVIRSSTAPPPRRQRLMRRR